MDFSRSLVLALKGCAMGMADVVPGVSGGTIAFISGIYEELIGSIRRVDLTALRLLCRGRFRESWRHFNGSFLLPVSIGIGVAIFSLARLMTWLLTHHPIEIWSFFFGLIIASALLVAQQIKRWNAAAVIALAVGTAVAGELNLPVLFVFAVGAVAGILSFSHLLSWLLRHWHDTTIAALMGFMIGSLNKVWPWKETVATFVDHHGKTAPLLEHNVSPGRFEALTGQDAQLGSALLLCLIGLLSIYAIESAARILIEKRKK